MTDEPNEHDDDQDDEEFDWSEAERRAKFFDEAGEAIKRIRAKKYMPVPLARLPKGTRFEVVTYSDGHEPLECTLLDPSAGAVTVQDNFYFLEPTTCLLWGSDDDLDGNGVQLPGIIKHNAKVVFHVDGKRVKETGPELRIMRLVLHIGEKPFNPWE